MTVLLLLVVVPTEAIATPTLWVQPSPGSSVEPTTTGAATVLEAPFSARAGFSSEYKGLASDVVPAQGSQLIVVTFEPRNPSFFANPASGTAPLTAAQIAERFGLTVAEYAAVEQYFVAEGLSIVHTWPDRLSLTLLGPVAAVDRAFGTTIDAGWDHSTRVTFPTVPPQLPPGIEPLIGSVVGLSSGFDTFSTAPLESVSSTSQSPSQGSLDMVTPAVARYIYGLSNLYNVSGSSRFAGSESIALLLWGFGYAPTDIQTFFSQDYPSSFPHPTVNAYPVDGAPAPSANAVYDPCKASQELTLDLEWSGSMAPGATLDAVYAPETAAPGCSPSTVSMTDALHQAVSLPVAAVSMSFGTPESTDAALEAAWQTYIAEAAQKGITLLAATGDLGGDAQANCQGGPAVDYPSTSPDVLAVGGTDVSLERSLLGTVNGFTESGWSESSGGTSAQFAAPSWQNSGSGNRAVPDVSATAADNFEYYDGANQMAGGTSFATPLWAGLITEMDAIRGTPFGLISPRLYAVGEAEATPGVRTATGLADITTGSNCVASAGPGWDAVTGWGSPRALPLYEDLTATFVNLSIAVSPSTVAQGGSITITGHLANATTSAPIANVPVVVSLVSSSDIGPCTGVFGSTTSPTDGAGNISVSIGIPVCYLGSHAMAEVVVTTDGYYGSNSTTVAVNLLGLVPALGALASYPDNVVAFVLIMAAAATLGYFLGRGPYPSRSVSPVPPPGPPPSSASSRTAETAPVPPAEPPPSPDDTQKT
jgi:kumamolisin